MTPGITETSTKASANALSGAATATRACSCVLRQLGKQARGTPRAHIIFFAKLKERGWSEAGPKYTTILTKSMWLLVVVRVDGSCRSRYLFNYAFIHVIAGHLRAIAFAHAQARARQGSQKKIISAYDGFSNTSPSAKSAPLICLRCK